MMRPEPKIATSKDKAELIVQCFYIRDEVEPQPTTVIAHLLHDYLPPNCI